MTKREHFGTVMTVLSETFNRPLTDGVLEGYWMALSDLSEQEIAEAGLRALKACKFMPAPMELRTFVGRSLEAEVAEAWEAVRHAIDKHDYTDSVDFGALVNAVVRNMGGWDMLCRATLKDLDIWQRKRFEEVYAAFRDKDPTALNGDYHRGAFKGPPHRIQIGTVPPAPQLESAGRKEIRVLVKDLADSKS